jgi:hypothetical protein
VALAARLDKTSLVIPPPARAKRQKTGVVQNLSNATAILFSQFSQRHDLASAPLVLINFQK